jgi:hypothetical protein
MALFGKKKAAPSAGQASAGEPRLDRSSIADVLRHLEAERDASNATAAAEFGLDEVAEWSLDLQAGTAKFTTRSGQWIGNVDVLGSLNVASRSWMWGWANPKISDELTSASFGVAQLGKAQSIPSLTTPTLEADEQDAASLAALAFGFAQSQFLFRTPTDPAFYLAVRDIRAD